MHLNLNDPASVAAWYRVNPARHAEFLRHCLASTAWERFWPAIKSARDLVAPQR